MPPERGSIKEKNSATRSDAAHARGKQRCAPDDASIQVFSFTAPCATDRRTFVPTSGTSGPHESPPEWRATLLRAAAWRASVGMNLSDAHLARNARAAFTCTGTEFYGYRCWECILAKSDGSREFRVVVVSPDGRSILKDATTDPEALGCALAEHARRKRIQLR